VLEKAQHYLHRFETYLLAVLLTALLVMSVLQILLRVFFDTGFLWAEPVSRQGVLWLALRHAREKTHRHRCLAASASSKNPSSRLDHHSTRRRRNLRGLGLVWLGHGAIGARSARDIRGEYSQLVADVRFRCRVCLDQPALRFCGFQ